MALDWETNSTYYYVDKQWNMMQMIWKIEY